MMNIRRTWQSDTLPVDLEDLKLDLRVDSDDEDDTIVRLAQGAADLIEKRTSLVIVPGEYVAAMDCWPTRSGQYKINRGPLRELRAFQWIDSDKVWQDSDLATLYTETFERAFTVQPLKTFDFPAADSMLEVANPIRIRFLAGYDVEDSNVSGESFPLQGGLRSLFIALVGHYYANRELFAADKLTEIESTAGGLLNAYRNYF